MTKQPTTLKTGDRIHYRGDICNQPGNGTICRQYSNRWTACAYDIMLDDGRRFPGVQASNFELPGKQGGHRFETEPAAYLDR